ncbi:MAG TPA: cytochrome P450 [Actinocrinis sp.]|nr:cytochrome P450 [Actinocrinis sp.]
MADTVTGAATGTTAQAADDTEPGLMAAVTTTAPARPAARPAAARTPTRARPAAAPAAAVTTTSSPIPAPRPTIPPGPGLTSRLHGISFAFNRRKTMARMHQKYGSAFTLRLPLYGQTVFISDPALVKQLFTSGPDLIGNIEPNLGKVLGRGSFFNLDGAAHRRQRKLLLPPFHGRRVLTYESIIEEETLRECANWPENERFETLAPMMRLTLNAILRAVFGAEGEQFETLRDLLPPMIELGSKLVALPGPQVDLGRWSPWGRYHAYRRRFDEVVDTLISKALADPGLDERNDVLSLMLQARYDDGSAMPRSDVADQLVTLLAAGHETTATTLSWAVERLRRHPQLLARLVAEADAGGSELRRATMLEVQRCRPVIDLTARKVKAPSLPLGRWSLPRDYNVLVAITLVHGDDAVFPDAAAFDPDRFVGVNPDTYSWVPFGGGTRRCIGAAFAAMEMDVVLRTLLREFDFAGTDEPAEDWHSRGVAYAPSEGGVAVVRRRRPAPAGQGAESPEAD